MRGQDSIGGGVKDGKEGGFKKNTERENCTTYIYIYIQNDINAWECLILHRNLLSIH